MALPVVVGVDGSDESLAAAEWAADEALRRRLPLRVVYVQPPWVEEQPRDERTAEVHRWMVKSAEEAVAAARERVVSRSADIEVTDAVVSGTPAAVLIDEATEATMVVTGARGLSGVSALMVGSVSQQVAAHAPGVVVVVHRPSVLLRREIVVGVDGSENSRAAVRFAFEEAALRGARLRVVHAFAHPVSGGPGDMLPLVYSADELAKEERRWLAEWMAGWREEYPDVHVTLRTVHGSAVHALTGASVYADLLVVGSRGRGGFRGLLLGSVSQGVLHHVRCPVAVVKPVRAASPA